MKIILKNGNFPMAVLGHHSGVPQGSGLGPPLFILYIAPLEDLIRAHSLMFYADDAQVYIITNPADVPASVSNLRKCLSSDE